MKKNYTKPVVQSEKLEFGVFGCYTNVRNTYKRTDYSRYRDRNRGQSFNWPWKKKY